MKVMMAMGAGLLALAPAISLAAAPGYFDLYFIPKTNLDPGFAVFDQDEDGDGFGGKLMAPVSDWGILTGEYQSTEFDDSDAELDQIRFGLGVMTDGQARVGVLAEYVRLEFDVPGFLPFDADGFGLHGRVEFDPAPGFTLHGQVGYIRVEEGPGELDGVEVAVGAAANINTALGVFVDYRLSQLEDNFENDNDLADVRVGVRVNFGL